MKTIKHKTYNIPTYCQIGCVVVLWDNESIKYSKRKWHNDIFSHQTLQNERWQRYKKTSFFFNFFSSFLKNVSFSQLFWNDKWLLFASLPISPKWMEVCGILTAPCTLKCVQQADFVFKSAIYTFYFFERKI